MATVTMTGKEYFELMAQAEQGRELVEAIIKQNQVHFNETTGRYCSCEWPNEDKRPEWLQQRLVDDMVDQLMNMSDEEFSQWAKTKEIYYHPVRKAFDGWQGDGRYDLLKANEHLKCRYEAYWDEINGKEESEETDE